MFSFPILWATPVFGVCSCFPNPTTPFSTIHIRAIQPFPAAYLKAPEMNSYLYLYTEMCIIHTTQGMLGEILQRYDSILEPYIASPQVQCFCIRGILTIPIYVRNKFEIYSSRYTTKLTQYKAKYYFALGSHFHPPTYTHPLVFELTIFSRILASLLYMGENIP